VKKAKEVGHHPQVILAGRSINDGMPKYVAEMAVKGLNKVGKVINGSNVLIQVVIYSLLVKRLVALRVEHVRRHYRSYTLFLGPTLTTDIKNVESSISRTTRWGPTRW